MHQAIKSRLLEGQESLLKAQHDLSRSEQDLSRLSAAHSRGEIIPLEELTEIVKRRMESDKSIEEVVNVRSLIVAIYAASLDSKKDGKPMAVVEGAPEPDLPSSGRYSWLPLEKAEKLGLKVIEKIHPNEEK